ncbi:MAG: glycolate oxidase iron-sulfur subunit [Clostridia bacterium]|nr:glycolate oxidase iron-sulfur subunit [Clostridia bacterium]
MSSSNEAQVQATDDLLPEANRCSRCGACRTVCPVFQVEGTETSLARGKAQLYRGLRKGLLMPTKELRHLAGKCLLCRTCVTNCPSDIPVDQIVLDMRQELVHTMGIPVYKKLLFRGLEQGGSFYKLGRAAERFLRLPQRIFPGRVKKWLEVLPDLPASTFRAQLNLAAARGMLDREKGVLFSRAEKRAHRVAYFYGCANNYFYPQTGWDFLQVMRARQVEVVIPPQGCCGQPQLAAGVTAERQAARIKEAFAPLRVEAIVTDCASCGSALKQLFPGISLGAPVQDVTEFLTSIGLGRLPGLPGARRLTYHDPCHAKRYQGISSAPRELLRAVPGVELIEMASPDTCCGGSGSFSLEYSDLSEQIGRKKLEDILATGAEAVVTACPSCLMRITSLLRVEGVPVRAIHLLRILAEAYAGPGNPTGA